MIGTPDGTILPVVDLADLGGRKTHAYEVQNNGALKNQRFFRESGWDGMTIDHEGNLHLTGKSITIFDPSGRRIRRILVDATWTAMVCSGGEDRRTLFIMASQHLLGNRALIRS